ncbi:MAG: TetR family transcriptional regulator [Candidatus Hydrogenedentes bacterium]|nr:TetR family transcriptional regulator [Candidatus Hydrogenedentota bacterium]
MARRTKEEAQETRKRILDAALHVFAAKGYSRATFVDVARRIGMTKGAVYWHFENKQALLAALIEYMHGREQALLEADLPDTASLNGLKDYLVAHMRIATRDEEFRKFSMFILLQMEWSADMITAVREELMKFRAEPFEELSGILAQAQRRGEVRNGSDIKAAKGMLTGVWLGLLTAHLQGMLSADPVEAAEVAFTALIDSLRA